MGKIGSSGVITWEAVTKYGNGYNPSVALVNNHVVEVQAKTGTGSLWYRVGTVNSAGTSIAWKGHWRYDTGCYPAVTLTGAAVNEVHTASCPVVDFTLYSFGTAAF